MVLSRDGKLKALFAFLVVSAASVRAIPFLYPWGADLSNLLAYQNCARGGSAYLIPGSACHDGWARDLVYPPLLFHSFFWIRALSLKSAMTVWSVANMVAAVGVLYSWSLLGTRGGPPSLKLGGERGWELVVFGALLTLQFPFIFLLERGGTDMVPVVLWTGAAALFARRRILAAGALAGAAAAFKLYPAIPCAEISLGLAWAARQKAGVRKMDGVRFGGAAAAAFAALNLLFYRDSLLYFTSVLPRFSKALTEPRVWSHALPSFAGAEHALYPKWPLLLLFALWCWSAARALPLRPAMAFAGVLAASTFFSATSWDYNLVTTYPLLAILFVEARRTGRFGTLGFGVFAIVGDRSVFATDYLGVLNPSVHLAIEFAWLAVAGIEIALPSAKDAFPLLP